MSWLPLLLSVWIAVDVVIVGVLVHLSRRRATARRVAPGAQRSLHRARSARRPAA